MLLCGQLRLRAPVVPLRVLPPVLVRLLLAPGELARARELAVPAALVLPLSSQSS
jgi:hypothetical protein